MKNVILSLLLIFSLMLSGCTVEMASPPAVAESSPETAELEVTVLPYDQQKALIEANRAQWELDRDYCPWFYTITDLDMNGRLEIICACTQGTGVFTTAFVWELSEDFKTLVPCADFIEEGMSFPEIIVDSAERYFDADSGQYWYVFSDLTKNGYAEQYLSTIALCLEKGQIMSSTIASKEILYKDVQGEPEISCTDHEGRPISEADFESAAERAFAGFEKSSLSLEWTRVEQPPQEHAVQIPTTTQAPVYNGPAPVITKSPSSESLSAGGKTWFIAHADNAHSITWLFTSPQGQQYSLEETMTIHPGLALEVLPEDTIAVANVPVSFNGWGISARFDGPGGYAFSETAYISVGDFAAAYEPVIEKYRYAYASGNANADYAVENSLSYLINYIDVLGYAMKDIDKNGVPELIIAPVSGEYIDKNMIVELYTLVNGQLIKLCDSMERARFYLLSDNSIFYEGSSGASYQTYELLRLENYLLKFIEGYSSSNSSDFSGNVFYHTSIIKPQFDGSWGDYDRYDFSASRVDVENLMDGIRQSVWMPQLTPIN